MLLSIVFLNTRQSNLFNTDTEGTERSVHISSLCGGYGYFLELHNNRCVQYFTDCFSAYMPTLQDKIEL